MPKVIVIGSANMDLTVRVERLPQLGETVSAGEFYTSFGGKGANQAVAAHNVGADVTFIAKVGCDQNGEAIVKHLEAHGLSSGGIVRDKIHPAGVALIMVDRNGNNAIAVAPGSNRHLTKRDIRRAESHIASASVLLIQLEVPPLTVRDALRLAKTHNLVTILNPAPARSLSQEILSLVDILTPNEVEAAALTGIMIQDLNEVEQASRRLIESGAGQVVTTLGEKGACWVRKDHVQTFPSFPVTPVDSTAAGDAFNGALACALAEGQSMTEAISFANAAGALTVMNKGAQDSLPARATVEQLLKQLDG